MRRDVRPFLHLVVVMRSDYVQGWLKLGAKVRRVQSTKVRGAKTVSK